MPDKDLILRATATQAPFRFVLIDLTRTVNQIGQMHTARAHTLSLLAETSVASLLLSSGLKYSGSVSLHVDFSGDLSFVQADSTPMGLVRAMIPFDEIQKAGDFELMLSPQRLRVRRLDEHAHLVQESVVEAASSHMGQNLAAFLMQSDQTRSGVGVFSKANSHDDTRLDYAGGFLVEAYPGAEDRHLEILDRVIRDMPSWDTFVQVDGGLDLRLLLDRLAGPFETEVVRELVPAAHCPCSKIRTLDSLAAMPRQDLEQLAAENTDLEITCDFCRTMYLISAKDLRELLDNLPPK
ncbi:MAG TPA: Hsp33 family molecular chaperone HslO [Fibrobacteraceae bacterium]|nr:Hsp33 family molecular chaperone HslO [Fibrobacteraceae bacterium]